MSNEDKKDSKTQDNTKDETNGEDDNSSVSPKTGDTSNLWILIALAFVSGGTLFGVSLCKEKAKAE